VSEEKNLPVVKLCSMGTLGADYVMGAITEDGDVIHTWVCSNPSWARHDLHDRFGAEKFYIEKFGGYGDGVFYQIVDTGGEYWAEKS
jgi:hypothetical protein